jgi:Phosphoesterase family
VSDGAVTRVIILVQENHTTDNYFRGLAPWGARVATGWPLCSDPPPSPPFDASHPPHGRRAYFDWLTGNSQGEHSQFETADVLRFYLYLATTGAFLENHCSGFGTNSTPNHLLLVGGQSPTLRNKNGLWDMPSVPGLAEDNAVSWRCYGTNEFDPNVIYPVDFYTQLHGSANVVTVEHLLDDIEQHWPLPELVYAWHEDADNEHPPSSVQKGSETIWQVVDAVVKAGGWEETVFMLTWDDWGGFDDDVATPVAEYTPDNVQLAYGPRVPLLMFGGYVKPGIDSRWCSHVSVPKTAMQLLGLPRLDVPRVDDDPGLADLVDPAMTPTPPPPAFHSEITIPAPPNPTPPMQPLPPPPLAQPVPVPRVILRDGSTIDPPNDQPLPQQKEPPKQITT